MQQPAPGCCTPCLNATPRGQMYHDARSPRKLRGRRREPMAGRHTAHPGARPHLQQNAQMGDLQNGHPRLQMHMHRPCGVAHLTGTRPGRLPWGPTANRPKSHPRRKITLGTTPPGTTPPMNPTPRPILPRASEESRTSYLHRASARCDQALFGDRRRQRRRRGRHGAAGDRRDRAACQDALRGHLDAYSDSTGGRPGMGWQGRGQKDRPDVAEAASGRGRGAAVEVPRAPGGRVRWRPPSRPARTVQRGPT